MTPRRHGKPWYTSKTVWLNVVAFLIAAVALLQQSPIVPAEYGDALVLIVALLNLVVRFFTTEPLRRGKP